MKLPTLLQSSPDKTQFAGVTYHLDGGLVPALTVDIAPERGVYFEHHTLLWKSTGVTIGVKRLAGAFNRFFSGMPIFMTEAQGSGPIAFSRDGVGQIFPLHLSRGQEIDIREHQFLAATDSVSYSFQRVQGLANILFGNSGFFIDKFTATDNDGVVFLYGYGNVFEVNLGAGEQIDVEPSAWLYKDPSVQMDTTLTNLSTGFLGGSSFTLNRFTGPGRLGIQSMSLMSIEQNATKATNNAAADSLGVMGLAAAAFRMFGKE